MSGLAVDRERGVEDPPPLWGEDEAKGELAKAYVILKPGTSATKDALLQHCRQHLAAYKMPRALQFVDDVPKTSTGKIMRRSLEDIDDGSRAP